MAIYIGNTPISKVFKGNTEITKLFQGNNAAYSSADSGTIFYLVIAGGGAGGGGPRYFNGGGGGGAGGYLASSIADIASGSSITIVVGAGGAGAQTSGGDGGDSSITSAAGSSFTTVTSDGGGGGSSQVSGQTPGNGGSGGGAVYHAPSQAGGSATAGQGNDGGDVNFSNVGGAGGGGKGSAGQTLNSYAEVGWSGGDGGSGEASTITGTSVTRAGGGGGGTYSGNSTDPGTGGSGGGGGGSANGTGTAGTTNLGGGGGGSGNFSSGNSGGAGGSGVVILAYDSGSISAAGGVARARSDGYVYHTFNSSGTLTVGSKTDFTALNGSNFNAITYVGDRPTNAGKTGMGFQPDLVIVKGRSFSDHWSVLDSTRGANMLGTNLTDAQSSFSGWSFDSDGFTVGSSGQANSNGETHIGWGWKATGGTTTSNDDGDVTSEVQANTAGGFSIVKWTGTGGNIDIGHGLGTEPKFIIMKSATSTGEWVTWHTGYGGGDKYIYLNQSGAVGTQSQFFRALPTSTVFKIGNHSDINASGQTIIAYCFADVAGYQKFDSYSGTGSSLAITTGFQPRFVLARKISPGGDRWLVVDSFRGGNTNNDSFLDFQDTLSERDMNAINGLTFNSNGFTINTTDGALNNSSGTYIYWAIA